MPAIWKGGNRIIRSFNLKGTVLDIHPMMVKGSNLRLTLVKKLSVPGNAK